MSGEKRLKTQSLDPWYGSNTDITERKQTEKQLYFQAQLLDSVQESIIATDLEGHIIYWGKGAETLYGYSAEEVMARSIALIVEPQELVEEEERMRQVRETGQWQGEYLQRRKDGSLFWADTTISLMFDENGQPCGSIGIDRDITERKQAQQEKEQLLKRERAARKEAEATNRIKNEFLAVLSHELRTPISLILGWAQLLQTGKLDEQTTQQAIETIERYAKLQTQLIEDLLDVSRILQGKMVLNVCPVDLVPVIEGALETVRLAAEAKGIKIQKILAADLGRVSGDSARLQQVVWNLLSNAIKFTPQGGRVEVKLSLVTGHSLLVEEGQITTDQELITNDKFVQIQVRDTGKGIAPDFLPYVFDYFRQEDGTSTRMFGGLGLGLTLVRYLTELHGGTVRAESLGEGQGASFTVRLPLWTPENRNIETSFNQNS